MTTYFLEIWRELKPNETPTNPKLTLKANTVKHFFKLEDAWNHVLENNIKHYVVYEAECIIDQTYGESKSK